MVVRTSSYLVPTESSSEVALNPRPSNPPEISSMVQVVCTPSYVVPTECSSEVVLNPRPSNPPEISSMAAWCHWCVLQAM